MIDAQVDCIVRLHDSTRLMELKRCIFSLLGQSHPSVHIVLATQRFSDTEITMVRSALAPMLSMAGAPPCTIVNWTSPLPRDARTELLNMGLVAATGRYVAFLDYDDTLFPDAYEILVQRLVSTDAAIAFASVATIQAEIFPEFVHIRGAVPAPFAGKGLADLLGGNFCPIHSYLIDRKRLPPEVLAFDNSLVWEEDYDLLLRISACALSDFEALNHVIGDYYFKTDGSNSVWNDAVLSESKATTYEGVAARIEMRRLTTLVSPEVQRIFYTPEEVDPHLTVRGLLDRLTSGNHLR